MNKIKWRPATVNDVGMVAGFSDYNGAEVPLKYAILGAVHQDDKKFQIGSGRRYLKAYIVERELSDEELLRSTETVK